MTANRDIGDLTTDPGGKTGDEWTAGARESVLALWALAGGHLINVAGTNTITADAAVSTGLTAYTDGMRVSWVPVATNTGAGTLNVSEIGAKTLADPDGAAIAAGAVVLGRLAEAQFLAADDGFRLVTSGGTSNITVTGGIIVKRSTPTRLVADTTTATTATVVASQAFQCEYATSRVIVEGFVSLVSGAGSADTNGLTVALLVDDNPEDSFTGPVLPSQLSGVPFAFEYLPGDISSHTYKIQVTSTITASYIAGATVLFCSEMSPNP
tara:strand:+ start:806 stop:1609 length:804 start_codon:yes stop_codon:yes gene_type:complete